mgnify:CR=1 FL=1
MIELPEPENDDEDDYFEEPPCERCHGDGMDPWNDYLLTCPLCLGDAKL